ncbi:MAG: deoxyguanosinetriphosphate triphosphohydrolase [Candidatus Dadabacteria bacterium]|nr:deoxyguanosinetriphosphate triphosphohydrolase [Candidatus Dadabacteria bacterium]
MTAGKKTVRERFQEKEKQFLSPFAVLSSQTKGRKRKERECPIRTPFQRDRDRIVHSKAFRRMKHKTQVFLSPTNDHYRTRLTHVLEVLQIARTIARALALNEDLAEAIAMGHDLGHTPFGHTGERALNHVFPGGFSHVKHSVRVVELLENGGKGLNLTREVLDGIARHSKGRGPIDGGKFAPQTLEGQSVRVSDLIAYANHDIDDSVRSGIISQDDLPRECVKTLGKTASQRLDRTVRDIVEQTGKCGYERISISPEFEQAMVEIREYLFNKVYLTDEVSREAERAGKMVETLYQYFCDNKKEAREWGVKPARKEDGHERAVCDFVAGMTDFYAADAFKKIFVPSRWRGGERL